MMEENNQTEDSGFSTPIISVVMPVHKCRSIHELKLAIESVLHQNFKKIEFIICDDAADKEIKQTLESYQKKDSRIIILHNSMNIGVAASLNRCIRVSSGKYIARMDGDDISGPERFQTQYDFLEQHKEYAFVGCNAKLIDEHGIWGTRLMPEIPNEKDFLFYSPYIHPSIMGRKELFTHDGGYRVSKQTWRCEDYEFFMRQFCQEYYGYNIQSCLFSYREDMNTYRKQKYKYSVYEAIIRLKGYRKMGTLLKGGVIYWMKPLVVGLIPKRLYALWKKTFLAETQERVEYEQKETIQL